jgi:hypothetical protein
MVIPSIDFKYRLHCPQAKAALGADCISLRHRNMNRPGSPQLFHNRIPLQTPIPQVSLPVNIFSLQWNNEIFPPCDRSR